MQSIDNSLIMVYHLFIGVGIIFYFFHYMFISNVIPENGYWVDENQNRWKRELYTRSQAIKYSKSMKECYGCVDSHDCISCVDCIDSDNCESCTKSDLCSYCKDCMNCYRCSACIKCNYCKICECSCGCSYNQRANECIICENCFNCYDCKNCKDGKWLYQCINYYEQPRIYVTKKMEYKNLRLNFYCDDYNDLQIVCGCENYNLVTFEMTFLKLVQKNGIDIKPYKKELEKAMALFGIKDKEDVYSNGIHRKPVFL